MSATFENASQKFALSGVPQSSISNDRKCLLTYATIAEHPRSTSAVLTRKTDVVFIFEVLLLSHEARLVTSETGQLTATQLRCIAIERYPLLRAPIPPGILLNHTSGRAHQISLAKATAASAPPNCRPSESKSRISRSNSSRDIPSKAPTRESCRGATASPLRSKIGDNHRAIRVQNAHSTSKNNHPRACRPFPSVNSDVSEIMGFFFYAFPVLSVVEDSLNITIFSAASL